MLTADTNPGEACVSRSLEKKNTFLILSYSKTNYEKCLLCGVI